MDFIPNLIKYNRLSSSSRFNYEGNRGTSAVSLLLKKGEEASISTGDAKRRRIGMCEEGRKERRKEWMGARERQRRCLSQIRPVERGRWL